MVSGAYSSIFIATPLLAQLKERTPDMTKLRARVASRREREGQKAGAPVRRPASTSDVDGDHAVSPAAVAAATVPVKASSSPATGDRTLRRPQPQHKPRSQRKK
jgi:preprotein translocase subunit SecF